jgi:hypothetical protein
VCSVSQGGSLVFADSVDGTTNQKPSDRHMFLIITYGGFVLYLLICLKIVGTIERSGPWAE